MRKTVSVLGVLLSFGVLTACSSVNNLVGSSGACTDTVNGAVVACASYSGLESVAASQVCPTNKPGYAAVAACPTSNVIGTCTYTETSSGLTWDYLITAYGGNGATCAVAKAACAAAASSSNGTTVTTSFSGGC